MKLSRLRSNSTKSRIQLLHQYYSYTGFYEFVLLALKNAFPYIVGFIAAIVTLNQFVDINLTLERVTQLLPVYGVLGFFFVSETILGLVPPEIFIALSGNMPRPWQYLSILGLLSYSGGLMAYWLGKCITTMPTVHNYLEVKMAKQLRNSKKWGGILIVIGAILPLPFAVSCMTAGIINYPFKSVMYYGSLRIFRIFAYGFVIFSML